MTNIELYKILKKTLEDDNGAPTPMKIQFFTGGYYFEVNDVDVQYSDDTIVLI